VVHARGREIFAALEAIADSNDVRSFRLVNGKITFVHRRLWPALVRLADEFGTSGSPRSSRSTRPSGAHKNKSQHRLRVGSRRSCNRWRVPAVR
jgi:hypothetical protein